LAAVCKQFTAAGAWSLAIARSTTHAPPTYNVSYRRTDPDFEYHATFCTSFGESWTEAYARLESASSQRGSASTMGMLNSSCRRQCEWLMVRRLRSLTQTVAGSAAVAEATCDDVFA
jgi:hypothetical protein